MNSKEIKALEDTNICMKCLKKKATHFYNIGSRGYGSIYDNFNSKFHLCDDCAKPEYKTWVEEYPEELDYEEVYKYEENISKLIESFPLEAQELFYNRFAYGACANYNMAPQDWIDFKLNKLSHEKCKEYGFLSPQERLAYEERFPNCSCVVIKKYSDESQGSKCPMGVFGDEKGNIGLNYYSECYMCTKYKPRTNEIVIIDEIEEYYKHEKKRLEEMLNYATTRLDELEKNKGDYFNKNS